LFAKPLFSGRVTPKNIFKNILPLERQLRALLTTLSVPAAAYGTKFPSMSKMMFLGNYPEMPPSLTGIT